VVLRSAIENDQRRSWSERVLRWVLFGWLFMDMRRFRLLARLLWLYQRLGARALVRGAGVLKFFKLEAAERLLPNLPIQFVVPRGEMYPSALPQGVPLAFFAGCVMSTALAEIDRATIRVLQRANFSVSNPGGQGCCGALHAHGGDFSRAMELGRANIAAFERGDDEPIVVNSAGCGAMLKDYGHHFRLDPQWADRASRFSARVRDLSEVLVQHPPPTEHAVAGKVVYQDACHLLHAQRVSRQPRELLRRIPGLELAEIEEAGLCCGSAGVYNVTNPVESRHLQQRKLNHALARDPAIIVTANPGCLLQLKSGLAERGSHARVKHLAEVLDEASNP
jgi:glycolate oxidase iron-sulfur subunit